MEIAASLILIAVSLPLVASLAVAATPKARPQSLSDYFLYGEKLSPRDFERSSIGYSLQAAAIFLFLLWTLSYGLWAIVVPVSWGLGYVLVYFAAKHRFFDQFLRDPDTHTIHGYVGSKTSSNGLRNLLVVFVTLSTIIGIGGTMITEANYVIRWLTSSLLIHDDVVDTLEALGLFVVLGFGLMYVLWGGYRAVVYTDRIQVPAAYLSFSLFAILVAVISVLSNSSLVSFASLLALFTLFAGLFWAQFKLTSVTSSPFFWRAPVFGLLTVIALVATVALLTQVQFSELHWSIEQLPRSSGELSFGFGVIGLIALLVANIFWQFADISAYQRLQSVSKHLTDGRYEDKEAILRAILATGMGSGAAWSIIVVAAIPLFAMGLSDPYSISELLLFGDFPELGLTALLLFLFALTAFAISTIDAYVSAMAYVAHFDLLGGNEAENGNTANGPLVRAKWATILATIGVFVGYLTLRSLTSTDRLEQLLYAFYAVQISILPVVASALFANRTFALSGIFSILAGWAVSIAIVTNEPVLGIAPDSWWVLPPLGVLLVSSATYLLGMHFERRMEV